MVCLHQTKFWFSVPFLTRFCQFFGPELFQTRKQNLLHVRNSVPSSYVFCANSVPKTKKIIMSEILYKFCAISVPNSVQKNINTQETQKSGSENFSLDRNFWHNSSQILDRKVSENGTESRISSSVNSPLRMYSYKKITNKLSAQLLVRQVFSCLFNKKTQKNLRPIKTQRLFLTKKTSSVFEST